MHAASAPKARAPLVAALAVASGALWTAAIAGALTGRLDLPLGPLLAASVLVVAAAAVRRDALPPSLRALGDWMGLVTVAVGAALVLDREPRLAVAGAAVLVAAVVVAAWTPAAIAVLLLLGAGYGTLEAFAPGLPARNVMDVLLAGAAVAAVAAVVRAPRRPGLAFAPGLVLLATYVGVTTLQALNTEPLELGLQSLRLTAWPLLLLLVAAYAPWREEVRASLGRVVVLVAVLVGGYATYRWIAGPADRELELALSSGRNNDVFGTLRTFGSFQSRTELAGWCALVIPCCLAHALGATPRWRLVAGAGGVLCGIGLFAADNRGGLVAVVAGVLAVLALAGAARSLPRIRAGRILAVLGAVVLVGAGAFAVTLGGHERTASRFYDVVQDPGQDVSFVVRSARYRAALDEVEAHPLGQGLGTAGGLAIQRRLDTIGAYNLDSSLLKVALEQGVPVLLLLAAGLLLTLVDLVRRARTAVDPREGVPAVAAAGTLVALGVLLPIGLFIESPFIATAWLVVGLGAAGATVSRSGRADP